MQLGRSKLTTNTKQKTRQKRTTSKGGDIVTPCKHNDARRRVACHSAGVGYGHGAAIAAVGIMALA